MPASSTSPMAASLTGRPDAATREIGAIRSLTGEVAHDFNNLLGIIIANLDLLAEELGSSSQPALLAKEALEAALRGAELTHQLLALADREPLAPKPVSVNELASKLTDTLRSTLAAGVELKLDLDNSVATALADPGQLESSLGHLLASARDAMPAAGMLMLTTANRRIAEHAELNPGDYVLIEIGDTGTAIPPEAIAQIADPSRPAPGGNGRNVSRLALIAHFLRMSGGLLEVTSAAGVGTTFRMYLPVAEQPASAGTSMPTPELSGTETILVVDDNASMRRVVVRQLHDLGYRVLEAEDGPAALMLLNSESVQLLFTDVVMPGGLSGYDLARLVLSRRPEMKALITSGFPELEPHGDSASQATLRRLIKPYRKAELATALRDVLDA